MHEWAVAKGVVDWLASLGRPVRRIVVGVGELNAYDTEVLETALRELMAEAGLGWAELVLREVKARFVCRRCGREWGMGEAWGQLREVFCPEEEDCETPVHYVPELVHAFVRCPGCGSRDYEVAEGRGLTVLEVS